MASPKMLPTDASIKSFLEGVSEDRRARVYISGWKDHVAIYPVILGLFT